MKIAVILNIYLNYIMLAWCSGAPWWWGNLKQPLNSDMAQLALI